MRKSQQQVGAEPQRPQPMPLESLLKAFPVRSQRWAPRLLHALLSKTESDLANKSPSEIAGVDVPDRIDRDVIEWVLAVAIPGQPGTAGKLRISTVARTLLDADKTESAVTKWQNRDVAPVAVDQTVEQYSTPAFFTEWKPRFARNAYEIPSAALIAAMNSGYYGSKSQHC